MEGCLGGVIVVKNHQPLVHIIHQQVLTQFQTRWLRLGLVQSIRPTIKYRLGKANVVAYALSRSQRQLEECSMDDQTVERSVAIEEQISALSGVSVELTTEDLQKRTTTYKEDKSPIAAWVKLR